MKSGLVLLALVALTATLVAGSIEREPVKVTHRNSGPRYDLDEVERTRIAPPEGSGEPANQPSGVDSGDYGSLGHITIRRFFLVPMSPPPRRDSTDAESTEETGSSGPHLMPPTDPSKPLWPFLLRPSRPRQPEVAGGDLASRPSTLGAGVEREQSGVDRLQPTFDPIEMMINLMHQAMNIGPQGDGQPGLFPQDLNREASSKPEGESTDRKQLESSRPGKPSSNNETQEAVVEIEGKKYLRKTIINRHVGDNIILMTKRLIFVPLNETDAESSTAATSTSGPAVSTVSIQEATSTTSSADPRTSSSEIPSSTTTGSETSTSEQPTTEAPKTEQPSASTGAPAEETTAKESWVDKVSDAIDKAAERLIENRATSTVKPSEV